MFIFCIIENDTHDNYRRACIYLSCLQTILTLKKLSNVMLILKTVAKIYWCTLITRILKSFQCACICLPCWLAKCDPRFPIFSRIRQKMEKWEHDYAALFSESSQYSKMQHDDDWYVEFSKMHIIYRAHATISRSQLMATP